MSTYDAVLFVHVLAGIALVGHSLSALVIRKMTCEAPSVSALLCLLDIERRTTSWNPAVAFVLLASGIHLGSAGWWTEPWFAVSILGWLANSLLASLLIQRTHGALRKAATQPAGPDVGQIDRLRGSRRLTLSLAAMLGNDLGVLYLMIGKPGLAGSVAAMMAANVLAAAAFKRMHPRTGRLMADASHVAAGAEAALS